MSFHFAWRNLVFEESHELTIVGEAVVTAGALSSLRTPQLADRVTLARTLTGGGGGTARVQIADDVSVDGRIVQVIGLLDVETSVTGTEIGEGLQWSYLVAGDTTEEGIITVPTYYPGFPRHLFLVLPTPVQDVRGIDVAVETLLAGDGALTVSIGALWFGQALELPVGPLRLRHLEQARSTTTPGGQKFGEDSVTVRELRFDIESMSKELAIGSESTSQDVQQAIQYAGETGAVLAIPFAGNAHDRHRLGVYGVMTSTGEIVRRSAASWQWSGPVITEQR
jgi:hypothetical protein